MTTVRGVIVLVVALSSSILSFLPSLLTSVLVVVSKGVAMTELKFWWVGIEERQGLIIIIMVVVVGGRRSLVCLVIVESMAFSWQKWQLLLRTVEAAQKNNRC